MLPLVFRRFAPVDVVPHRAIAALAIVVVGAAAAAGCAGKSHAGAAAGGGDAAPAHPPKVHRPVATACPMTRPPGNVTTAPPAGDGSVIDCASEADCTAHDNGRCTRAASGWGTAGARCSYAHDDCVDAENCADALRKECAYERTARAWVCVGSCGAG